MDNTTAQLADALRALMDFAEFGDIAGKGRTIHDVKADARAVLAAYDAEQRRNTDYLYRS